MDNRTPRTTHRPPPPSTRASSCNPPKEPGPPSDPTGPDRPSSSSGAFLSAAIPLVLTQTNRGRAFFDHLNYHEPSIIRFAEQLPTPDVSNYLSATTPGYHLVLALASTVVSVHPIALQLVGMCFTLALITLFTRWITPRAGSALAVVFGLMLVSSLYVFPSGVYLLPDNAGWFGVLSILVIALRPRTDTRTLILGGAALVYLILVRQSHLWTLGVLVASSWIGPDAGSPSARPIDELRALFSITRTRLKRLALALLACAPAILVLGSFVNLWGGLTVPIYHDFMQGVNPSTPVFILTQLGFIGVFFSRFWVPRLLELVRASRSGIISFVIVAAAFSCVPPTTMSVEDGRYSGLWIIASKTPDIAHHSNPIMIVLAVAGALFVLSILSSLSARQRWVMLTALAAFVSALTVNVNAWQRYHEPMLLIWSALGATMTLEHLKIPKPTPAHIAGPALLALVLAGFTIRGLTPPGPEHPLPVQDSVSTPLRTLWPDHWDRIQDTHLNAPHPSENPTPTP